MASLHHYDDDIFGQAPQQQQRQHQQQQELRAAAAAATTNATASSITGATVQSPSILSVNSHLSHHSHPSIHGSGQSSHSGSFRSPRIPPIVAHEDNGDDDDVTGGDIAVVGGDFDRIDDGIIVPVPGGALERKGGKDSVPVQDEVAVIEEDANNINTATANIASASPRKVSTAESSSKSKATTSSRATNSYYSSSSAARMYGSRSYPSLPSAAKGSNNNVTAAPTALMIMRGSGKFNTDRSKEEFLKDLSWSSGGREDASMNVGGDDGNNVVDKEATSAVSDGNAKNSNSKKHSGGPGKSADRVYPEDILTNSYSMEGGMGMYGGHHPTHRNNFFNHYHPGNANTEPPNRNADGGGAPHRFNTSLVGPPPTTTTSSSASPHLGSAGIPVPQRGGGGIPPHHHLLHERERDLQADYYYGSQYYDYYNYESPGASPFRVPRGRGSGNGVGDFARFGGASMDGYYNDNYAPHRLPRDHPMMMDMYYSDYYNRHQQQRTSGLPPPSPGMPSQGHDQTLSNSGASSSSPSASPSVRNRPHEEKQQGYYRTEEKYDGRNSSGSDSHPGHHDREYYHGLPSSPGHSKSYQDSRPPMLIPQSQSRNQPQSLSYGMQYPPGYAHPPPQGIKGYSNAPPSPFLHAQQPQQQQHAPSHDRYQEGFIDPAATNLQRMAPPSKNSGKVAPDAAAATTATTIAVARARSSPQLASQCLVSDGTNNASSNSTVNSNNANSSTNSSSSNNKNNKKSSSSTNGNNNSKHVSFSTLQIRTYETILGDNPSCSGGPSLGLGWRYDPSHITARVDDYERLRATLYGDYDIRPEDLVLHRFEREAILLNTGYSRQDIAESVRGINKVKNRRRQTVHNLPVAWVEERMEVCRRTFRRVMLKKDRTRHLYDEWRRCSQGRIENAGARGALRRSI